MQSRITLDTELKIVLFSKNNLPTISFGVFLDIFYELCDALAGITEGFC